MRKTLLERRCEKDILRKKKTLWEKSFEKDVQRNTLWERRCKKTLWERKKTRCEKDVPSMDSMALLIDFPMFFFQWSTIVEAAEDLISFTDLLVDNICYDVFLTNFWAYTILCESAIKNGIIPNYRVPRLRLGTVQYFK